MDERDGTSMGVPLFEGTYNSTESTTPLGWVAVSLL